MDKVTRQFRLQQWAEALRDHKESGLTVMEWCRRHNVSKYQYYYRQDKGTWYLYIMNGKD